MICSAVELKAKRDRGEDLVVLDVRTDEELEIAALSDIVHIPLHALPARLGELDAHRDREIVVMCHHGGRSAHAQGFLLQQGFKKVLNLDGGIHAYASEVDRSVATY